MPRCLPRPTTLILVTAGKPASIKAARTASTLSGRTTDLIMIILWSSRVVLPGIIVVIPASPPVAAKTPLAIAWLRPGGKLAPGLLPAPSSRQPIVDKQLLQHLGAYGFGDNLHLVGFDLPGQGPVFIGLGMAGFVLDDGLPMDLGPLHHVIPGDEVNHLGAQLGGQGLDHLLFVIHVAAVADKAPQTHPAGFGELDDPLADIVGGVHGHHLAGDDDVDLLGLAFPDG